MTFLPFGTYHSVFCSGLLFYLKLHQLIARDFVDHFPCHLDQVGDLNLLFLFISLFCHSCKFQGLLGPLGFHFLALGPTQNFTSKIALNSTKIEGYLLCNALSLCLGCTGRVSRICFSCLLQNFTCFLRAKDPN